jgi:hypothetical protein
MLRVVLPPIIRSANNCIYNIWYLSHRYCYLPLSWKSWNRFECAVGGVRHPQQFPDINKLCNVASCWIYIGILLGAYPILHISRIRVNPLANTIVLFTELITVTVCDQTSNKYKERTITPTLEKCTDRHRISSYLEVRVS